MFIPPLFITYLVRKYLGLFLRRKDKVNKSGAWALGRVMVFLGEVRETKKGNWFGEKDGQLHYGIRS